MRPPSSSQITRRFSSIEGEREISLSSLSAADASGNSDSADPAVARQATRAKAVPKPYRMGRESKIDANTRYPWPRLDAIQSRRAGASLLFDGHALGEVAWLIDIAAAQHGDVVRKQL